MWNKADYYSAVAKETLGELTASWQEWVKFLTTASRLYKYPFMDQMMIYAQRPDATACAEYGLWADKMNRYIRRGSKGIALLNEQGDRLHLRYVFDVSDTGMKENARTPWLWTMQEQYKPSVSAMLEQNYDAHEGALGDQIAAAARTLADGYWEDNQQDFLDIVDDSFLAEYDEYTIGSQFKAAVTASVTYSVLNRCGLQPEQYMTHEDFFPIFDFNTIPAVMALGSAVSQCSRQILQQIGDVIRAAERESIIEGRTQNEEYLNLHQERGLPDSQPETGRAAPEASGQVRTDAPGLSEGEAPADLQPSAAEWDTVSPSAGDRGNSEPAHGVDDVTASGERPSTGQEAGRDSVGTAYERTEGPGRGSDSDGAYQQLTLDLFSPKIELIKPIDEAENVRPTSSAFSFAQETIDHVLRLGSNTDRQRERVTAVFEKQKPIQEIAAYLQNIYYGGNGFTTDSSSFTVWYGEDGIHLSHGKSARYDKSAQVIPWLAAAERIGQLLEDGRFATNVELVEAERYERRRLAEKIWHLRHDFSDEARDAGYLSSLDENPGLGFPEQTDWITEQLKDADFRADFSEEYQQFWAACQENPDVLRFHYHRLDEIRDALQELDLPRKTFISDMPEVPAAGQFITEDEIDAALSYGSGVAGGKGRIFTFFQNPHTDKEKVDFLKSEYGNGGHSHALSGTTGSNEWHDGKGIRYQKSGCPDVHLTWQKVAQRITGLIQKDRYLTSQEQEEYEKIQAEKALAETEDARAVQEPELSTQDEPVAQESFAPIEPTAITPEIEQPAKAAQDDPAVHADTEAVYPAEQNGLPYDIVTTRFHVEEPEQTPPLPAAENFRITDDHLGEGGPKQKFRANIMAIQLLKKCEEEDRPATPEEQKILSNYVGWGGLSDAFDERKENWSPEYLELKTVLTPEEYTAARASTLNAHYTSPTVIRAIYDAVEQMGFRKGNILEPSMGVGNFFGLLPESMQESRLYGVELDSISGRIAKKLYPNAEITIAGFETTDRRDFYDLAVGNVPFGDYKVNDKPYNKLGFSIHNYFFAKALDQVCPGGVVAFVISRYTMDAKSPEVRRYLAQRAKLLGAIRLPNNAFRANAGTDVVSDILFLQKREHPVDLDADWIHLARTEGGLTLNSYFVEHPEMVLGQLSIESTQYGKEECTVLPIEGADLSEQLKEAISHIHGHYQAMKQETSEIDGEDSPALLPADPAVKNFSYTVVDGEIYFRENSIMSPVETSETAKSRIKGMVELRQIVNDLIEYQLEDYPQKDIEAKQQELSAAYDVFTAKHGLINSRSNEQAFSEDSSYYLLCSLENIDENGNLESKADIFTKRTIRPEHHVTHVDTPSEALAVSIGERGKVDVPFMAELLGRPEEYEEVTSALRGVIFHDPLDSDSPEHGWQTADEYLSGNVRDKLRIAQLAAQTDPQYAVNVTALEKAQPKDLEASEIEVRLGATWIDPEYIQQFMQETFETPFYLRRAIEVKFSPITAEWQISGKSSPNRHDVAAYMTYGTDRANAYKILEDTLNLKDIRIYDVVEDVEGNKKRVLNKRETTLAQQKQQAIKDAFRDWIWRDPIRRQTLVTRYNELFNSTRPREYDGSHIHFVGMNRDIKLRPHQKNAIAHVLYGGNTLLAHEVGAGKTFEMAASAMESKRLGLCQKSMFVVPNHLTQQWANEFLRLYPSAKLLVTTKKDFETAKRKKFCARIASGDYDAVIIGHSQFEKIPISAERQERLLQEQIDEVTDALDKLKHNRGESFTIKQLEKTRKSLQVKLNKLLNTDRKDDVITFEQLGIDRLFVDESQAYKNLFLYTKMRNVAGLSTSEAQRSSDMFMKCQYLDEVTSGRGIVFASGTPVSNSMTELYTVMRYLQYNTLQQKGLTHFDCWASIFGESTTTIELAPEGTGYRARTRFSKFFNLPELMNLFKEVADIKTSDQLNLPMPEAKFETVMVQPSELQKEMVAALSERAAAVHSGQIDPSQDNMLKITSDGRKIGLDQRLMNPLLPDDPSSKLNACVGNVFRIWEEGRESRLTQLLFCDMSTPKDDGTFNVYDDIKAKLIAKGIPAEEITFIHDADNEVKKKELFAKVRTGQVRVLLGSTQKMGAGTNCQDLLVAVHHLDVGWRPSDMTQRNGRIIRQGNQNKQVQIYQYVTEGTFDAYLYQTLENKQKFISQIMTSKSPVRSCDDVDEQALSYAEIKALCAGDSRIKEKMDLDIDVARLKVLKSDHQSQQYRLEDRLLKYFPAEMEKQRGYIQGFEADMQTAATHPLPKEGFVSVEIHGRNFSDKELAGEAILAACKSYAGTEPVPLGIYRGFTMELSFDSFHQEYAIALKGSMTHTVTLRTDAKGNFTRMDNALAGLEGRKEKAQIQLENLENQQEAARAELGKPFPHEAELAEKSARLAELDAALNMDDHPVDKNEQTEPEQSPKQSAARPSVLADLKSKTAIVGNPSKHHKEREEVL